MSGKSVFYRLGETDALNRKTLVFKWGTSRGANSYGYTLCTLYVEGVKVARECGGGYDMKGAAFGDYIASAYRERLLLTALFPPGMEDWYGLTYHDPNFDPGKVVIGEGASDRTLGGSLGETVAEAERAGKSFGLERLQAAYSASSKWPTDRHVIPVIDGACGFPTVQNIARHIGLHLEYSSVLSGSKQEVYYLNDHGL